MRDSIQLLIRDDGGDSGVSSQNWLQTQNCGTELVGPRVGRSALGTTSPSRVTISVCTKTTFVRPVGFPPEPDLGCLASLVCDKPRGGRGSCGWPSDPGGRSTWWKLDVLEKACFETCLGDPVSSNKADRHPRSKAAQWQTLMLCCAALLVIDESRGFPGETGASLGTMRE